MDTNNGQAPKKDEVCLQKKSKSEILPIQQVGAHTEVTKKKVRDAVQELNPDTNSLDSRG